SFALSTAGSNFGSMFIGLKNYPERRSPDLHSDAIANELRRCFDEVTEAGIIVFPPPPVRGVGRAGGFALMIEDRGALAPQALQQRAEKLLARANLGAVVDQDDKGRPIRAGRPEPGLAMLFTSFRANVPQLHIEPNKRACMMKGVNLKDFADTLSVYEGSLYV